MPDRPQEEAQVAWEGRTRELLRYVGQLEASDWPHRKAGPAESGPVTNRARARARSHALAPADPHPSPHKGAAKQTQPAAL